MAPSLGTLSFPSQSYTFPTRPSSTSTSGAGKLSRQGQTVSILGCGPNGLCCSYSTLQPGAQKQLRHYATKCVWLASNKTLFTKKDSSLNLAYRPSSPNSALFVHKALHFHSSTYLCSFHLPPKMLFPALLPYFT